MIRNADRLEHLIDQLLDLSRLEAGRLPLHWRQGDCMAFLREFVQRLRGPGRPAITSPWRRRFPRNLRVAWFDADLLEKLVGNLMSNAVKHTPDGGRVEVRLLSARPPSPGPQISAGAAGTRSNRARPAG